jgi:hypothetical protein
MPICMDHVIISNSVLPSACKNLWPQHSAVIVRCGIRVVT